MHGHGHGGHAHGSYAHGASPSHNVFTFEAVHTRKDMQRITSLDIDSSTERMFLGLASGQVCGSVLGC